MWKAQLILVALCFSVQGLRHAKDQPPAKASLAISEPGCAVDKAPVAEFYGALGLTFPSNASISKFLIDAEAHEAKDAKPSEAAKAEWKSAMQEYAEAQKEMQSASSRLMNAMSAMLEVPNVDGAALASKVEKKEKDLLVVFYAPWCPHCQSFVLHDQKGSPENAPLEVFNRDMKARGADKTLSVLRFDTQESQDVPEGFEVKYIPTIYMAAADEKKTKFEGDARKGEDLVAFIEANSAKTKKIAAPKTQV